MRKPRILRAALLLLMVLILFLAGCEASAPVSAPAQTAPPASEPARPTATPRPALPEIKPRPFTVIWMSDTQYYSNAYLEYFTSMTEWTAAHKRIVRISYVIHTGDIVGTASKSYTWENAGSAMSVLLEAELPVFTVAGNHDSFSARTNDYTSYLEFRRPYLAPNEETYRDGLCTAVTFSDGGADFLLVGVSCNVMRKDAGAVDWVNGILDKYPDHVAILCFHSYMNIGGSLTGDGPVAFSDVIASHPNVRLVLAGHCRGVSHKQSSFDDDGDGEPDRVVDQIVMNYQNIKKGGLGYLGILGFDPSDGSMSVTAYSPFLDDVGYYSDGRDVFVVEDVF